MTFLNIQLSAFLLLVLTGIFLGLLFDCYRVLRGRIRSNLLIDFCGDLFFWFLALAITGLLLYWSVWLELRFYVWLTVGAGFVLYLTLFSPVMIPHLLRFWKAAGWLPRQSATGIGRISGFIRKLCWSPGKKRVACKKKESKKG